MYLVLRSITVAPIKGAVMKTVRPATVEPYIILFLCGMGNSSAVQVVKTHKHALIPILLSIDISNRSNR